METRLISSFSFSRRFFLSGASTISVLGLRSRSARAAKVSQSTVSYQGSPKGDQRCGTCKQFEPPSACRLIDGKISPQGWCKLWAKA